MDGAQDVLLHRRRRQWVVEHGRLAVVDDADVHLAAVDVQLPDDVPHEVPHGAESFLLDAAGRVDDEHNVGGVVAALSKIESLRWWQNIATKRIYFDSLDNTGFYFTA